MGVEQMSPVRCDQHKREFCAGTGGLERDIEVAECDHIYRRGWPRGQPCYGCASSPETTTRTRQKPQQSEPRPLTIAVLIRAAFTPRHSPRTPSDLRIVVRASHEPL